LKNGVPILGRRYLSRVLH